MLPAVRALYHSPEAAHPEFFAGEQALVLVTAGEGLEGAARRAFLLGVAAAALRAAGAGVQAVTETGA